jgi:hypothetical protein
MAAFQAPPRGHECGSMVPASMQAGVTVLGRVAFEHAKKQASQNNRDLPHHAP